MVCYMLFLLGFEFFFTTIFDQFDILEEDIEDIMDDSYFPWVMSDCWAFLLYSYLFLKLICFDLYNKTYSNCCLKYV